MKHALDKVAQRRIEEKEKKIIRTQVDIEERNGRERANDPNYKHFSWLFRGTFVGRGNDAYEPVHFIVHAPSVHSSYVLRRIPPPYRSWPKSTFPFSSASEHMRVDFLPSSPFSRPRSRHLLSPRSAHTQHTIGSTASIPSFRQREDPLALFHSAPFFTFFSIVCLPQVCPRSEK